MIEVNNLLKKIIFIPRDHYLLGNISEYDLVKNSEYYEHSDLINEENLYETLKKYPDSIDHWFTLSADNHGTPAWYITQTRDKKYKVKYTKLDPNFKTVEFDDKTRACAAFIARYLEQMCSHFKAEVLASREK
jgi:hypothetical protein